MRILFLDQFSDLGGAQLCLLDLLPAVAARGWQAWLAAPGNGPLLERAQVEEATSLSLGQYRSGRKSLGDYVRFGPDTLRAGREIATLVRRHRIGLLYVNGPRVLPAATWARRHLPLVFHCHSYLARPREAALAAWCINRAQARVIANCRYVARPFQGRLDPERLRVFYNGVADLGRPSVRDRSGPPRIGVIGRIGPEKGQTELLRAARIVQREIPGCRWVICGAPRSGDRDSERYYEEVRRVAADLPVEFTGWVEDVASLLASLDMLVVPSSAHEATTRVIVEAFSAGVPVLAARAGGIPEIIEHNKTGLLVETGDPGNLALALSAALRRPRAELRVMGVHARKAWQDRFRLDLWRERVLAVLDAAQQPPEEPTAE
jgi:glycosyltransferase involved in cell wall biosynthesis